MDALKGKQVGLIVAGREVSGLVTAVDGDFVTLVDRDMKLVMVPKAQITEIRAARDNGAASPARSSRPARTEIPPTGGGLYAGGILLTIFGAASLVSGMTFVFITPEDPILWATQAPPGLVMLTAGIPMTVEGARRRNLYRRALYERLGRLSPTVSRTAGGGWTGGITLRF
ncbi:hypothetical protein [Nannocystis sp.]|uniref:hypothetical protein n=1 Tax=Nannocystis sp. TaxID=1962667 RepID=UPI0024231373|nr:hypothetical protein [Nannocystis sp.]MBK7830034.1 hypothetical protein [Nannocystis sp.]MBK9752012.1 hypothetical protein [Nannocystis sp.]